MASLFLDSKCLIMFDYLEKKKKTTYGHNYASELRRLKETINLKRKDKLKASVFLLQNNAPVHTALVAVADKASCSFE